MATRSYICTGCGHLVRRLSLGIDVPIPTIHCGGSGMQPLTDEQNFVATHLDRETRLKWFWLGAHILKGPTKRKKWIPAFSLEEIEASKHQAAHHVKKKARTSVFFLRQGGYMDKISEQNRRIAERDREIQRLEEEF